MLYIDINQRMVAAFGHICNVPDQAKLKADIEAVRADAAINNAGKGRANIGLIQGKLNEVGVFVKSKQFADLVLKNTENGQEISFKSSFITEEDDSVLAPPPMLSFQRSKNIVTTSIDGSDAVVVESFGLKQWEITIEGILIDTKKHDYPQQKIVVFSEMYSANATYDVVECPLLHDLGIFAIYFENMPSLKVLAEYPDTVKYQLKAKSIKPAELSI